MKTMLLIAASLATLAGCSAALRSPEMYRDDTAKVLATKNDAIHACYDNVLKATPGASGKVTVKFDVETEAGKLQNIAVDKANSTAPDAVGECVTKNLEGLAISPPDGKLGQATFVYEFTAPTAPKI